MGLLQEAEDDSRRALSALESFYPARHPFMAEPIANLGDVLLLRGRPEEALREYQRALFVTEEALGKEHADVVPYLLRIGQTSIDLDRAGKAVAPLERGLRLIEADTHDPAVAARLRFQPARALSVVGGNDLESRRLAVAAFESFKELGERSRADLEATELWLQKRQWVP